MSIRIASHLFRNRHGTFYFRLVVPKDLRDSIKQREVRFSLQTEQRRQAMATALSLVTNLPTYMAELRRMADSSEKPIEKNLLMSWLDKVKENVRLKYRIDELEEMLADAEYRLKKSVPRDTAESVVKRALEKGDARGRDAIVKSLVFPWPPERTVHFSELRTAYLKSLSYRATGGRKKPPTAKTLSEYESSTEFFTIVMGDMRIGEIDKEIASVYFSILKQLPANLNKISKYKGKSIKELIAIKAPPQSEVTVSKKIERISTMFKWAIEEKRKWGIEANPFIGFGQEESIESTRRPFTNDELRALLTHPNFISRKFTNSYTFWLIPLALFTGARLGELCQLDLKDFIEVEGVACIDINDTEAIEVVPVEGGGKKRVKNKNSRRLVPIHSKLIDIGLLRHVDSLRKQGKVHLFPELSNERRDGKGHAASNWFQRFRKSVGVNAKQETVFHSFRHTFITNILDSEIAPHMLAPIVGHEAELVTGKIYWNKKDASKRKPTVEIFKLPDETVSLIPKVEDVVFSERRKLKSIKSK